MENKYIFYCDLDGVLVDFNKGYYDLTGKDISGSFHSDVDFWNPINAAGRKFWADLEWIKDGKKLWDYIKKYNPTILSAPSRQIESRVGKHDWMRRELPGVRLILRSPETKREFANPNSILIDDRESNVIQWKESGGISILHTSAEDTIKQLQTLNL